MIHYLRGQLASVYENAMIIDVNGVGYKVTVPLSSPLYLNAIGDTITVYTVMLVREDDMSLYGFEDEKSLNIFNKLTSVSGIGAKAAVAIFSALSRDEIVNAIVLEDAAALTRANGIGKKTALRIVLELKDKFDYEKDVNVALAAGAKDSVICGDACQEKNKREAIEALMGLGFTKAEAKDKVDVIDGVDLSVEEYIKKALVM